MVFGVGGSNGFISGSIKFRMALCAGHRHLENYSGSSDFPATARLSCFIMKCSKKRRVYNDKKPSCR